MTTDEPLEKIRRARLRRDSLYAERCRALARYAVEAHEAGYSWPRVAEAMGMTRQGLRAFIRKHG